LELSPHFGRRERSASAAAEMGDTMLGMASDTDPSRTNPPETQTAGPVYVKVDEVRPESYDGTCLRPLGLCELGGACDTCWYRPDHPRFRSD
jgi:hypothetical protein